MKTYQYSERMLTSVWLVYVDQRGICRRKDVEVEDFSAETSETQVLRKYPAVMLSLFTMDISSAGALYAVHSKGEVPCCY